MAKTETHAAPDGDAEQLRALGYESHFDRSISKWENFSLGFTYLSPVVGVYTIFASAFVAGGPPMWWNYILVGLGQLMVCLVFGEIVSQFPISGGLYPWARRLMGKRWAWMAGWVYAWALCCTMAGAATGVAPFLAQLFNTDSTPLATTMIALVLIVITTLLNLSGTRLLARVAMFGFLCELVGAIIVGGYLLLFARHQPLHVLIDGSFVPHAGSYLPAFLGSSLAALFCYYGFEACGDVAEETPDASRTIPQAMRMTIYIGGAAASWVCLAFVLSIDDIGAVISGRDKDPIVTLLRAAMGERGFDAVIVVVLVSFISCLLSLQAAASRLVFAYARDQMIFGSSLLRRVSPGKHVPATALIVMGAIPALIALSAMWLQDAIATIISFAAIGIYVSFQMIVVAALFARSRGWRPGGPFTLGAWGLTVNIVALAYVSVPSSICCGRAIPARRGTSTTACWRPPSASSCWARHICGSPAPMPMATRPQAMHTCSLGAKATSKGAGDADRIDGRCRAERRRVASQLAESRSEGAAPDHDFDRRHHRRRAVRQ